jgi:hypothetical protein
MGGQTSPAFDPNRLGPPPRTIATGTAARIVLGNGSSLIGWVLLAMGSFPFWSTAIQADLSGWQFREGAVEEVSGESLGCIKTRFSEGGSRYRRGTPIYQNRYRFAASGQELEGSSYAKGRCLAGGVVTVEYLRAKPQVSRIAGMRRKPLGPGSMFSLIVPLIGVIFALKGFLLGRRHLQLLRDGLLAPGHLIGKSRTMGGSRNRQAYKMTFEYSAAASMRRITARTNRPQRLEADPVQPVLYDPTTPEHAELLSVIPVTVGSDELGRPALQASISGFIVPVLTILGNALYVYHLLAP